MVSGARWQRSIASIVFVVLMVIGTVLAAAVSAPTPAHASTDAGAESQFVELINRERADRGLARLAVASDLVAVARDHSKDMAASGNLHHNPNLGSEVSNWQRVTENVGVGWSVSGLHSAFMGSSGHRANILDDNVTQVGVGVEVEENGRIWVTQIFRLPAGQSAPDPEPEPAPEPEPDPEHEAAPEPEQAADPEPEPEPEPAPDPGPSIATLAAAALDAVLAVNEPRATPRRIWRPFCVM